MDTLALEKPATQSELAEYERLFAWRARWTALAQKAEKGRVCARQERIERRAAICNFKIARAMHEYDTRVGNTYNPIGVGGVESYANDLILLS